MTADVQQPGARGRVSRQATAAIVAVAICAGWLAGCSGDLSFSIGGQSVEEAATELIEGELADQIGLGTLVASCPEVPEPEVGTEFACTAETVDGEVIEIAGVVDREDHIDLNTTNLIARAVLGEFESAGVGVLNDQQGLALDASAIDCGDTARVFGDDTTMVCTLTDPDTGDLFDATFTITNLDEGTFDLDVTAR